MSMPGLGAAQPGTAATVPLFREYACFLPLQQGNADQVLWPALQFDNYGQMMTFLRKREGVLVDRALLASLTNQRTHHVINRMNSSPDSDPDADPVALLLGGYNNPAKQKVVFCPTGQLDWDSNLLKVVLGASKEVKEALMAVQEIIKADEDDLWTTPAVASMPKESEKGNETLAIKDSAEKAVATKEEEEEEEEIPMKPPAKRKHGESTQSETLNTVTAEATKEMPATTDDTDESMTASEQEETPEQPEAKRSRPSGDSAAQNKPSAAAPAASTETLNTVTAKATKEIPTTTDDTDESMTASEQEETPEQPKAKRSRPSGDAVAQNKTSGTATSTKEAPADDADENMTSSEQHKDPDRQPEAKRTLFTKDTTVQNTTSAKTVSVAKDSESVDSITASEHEESPADKPVQAKRSKKGDASSKKVQQDEDESVDETFFTANSEESLATCSEQEESPPPLQPKRKRGLSKKAAEAKFKGRGRSKAPKSTKTTQKKAVPNKRKKPEPAADSRRKSARTANAEAGPKKKKSRREEMVLETPKISSTKRRFVNTSPSDSGSSPEAETSPESSVQSVPTKMPATIPDFRKEVLPLLKKVGLKCVRGKYFLQGVKPSDDDLVLDKDYFENVTRLRQYLCAYGIETQGFEFSVKQEETLMLWMSTAIVPGLRGLNGEVKPELRSFLSPGKVHSMLMRLGFKYRSSEAYYFLPGEKPNMIGGLGGICVNGRKMIRDELRNDDGLLMYLARFGLPQSCKFSNLTDDERLHLEYHISQYTRVDVLSKFEPKESDPPLFSEVDESSGQQTQQASPHSCRGSVGGATQVTNITEEERDQDETKDPEIRPDDESDASSSKSRSPNVAHEEDIANLPVTQAEYDSSAESGRELFDDDTTSQNQLSMDTKSTSQCVEEFCAGAAGEEKTSPQQPTKLSFDTPGAPASPTSEEAKETESNPETTSPPHSVFQEQVNDMLDGPDSQGTPGSDIVTEIIKGTTTREDASETGQAEPKDASEKASPAVRSSTKDSQYDVSPMVYINKNEEGNQVAAKMKALGWKCVNGTGPLDNEYFIAPGGKHPKEGGILGQDYVKEAFGLKKYAYEHLGWGGDEAFLKELHDENSPRSSRRRHVALTGSPETQKNSPEKRAAVPREQGGNKGNRLLPAGHPENKKTLRQKLKACQKALDTSFNVKNLSATSDQGPTLFQKNVDSITTFLQEAIDSDGAHGQEEGDPACLYVCGAPGVGKTSSIKWAIKKAARYSSSRQAAKSPSFCFISAADIASARNVTESIADALSIAKGSSVEHVRKALAAGKKCKCLIMVIDEIELLLSDKSSTTDKPVSSGEEALKVLGDWSAAQDIRFALIGISNSIGNQQAKRLQKFGLANNTVTFSSYRKNDLIKIVEDRVGSRIIDPKAIDFVASKVAATSGDARKVLEISSNAVAKCLESLSPEECKDTTLEKPIVSLKYMLKASRQTVQKVSDLIEELPALAKIILCVAVSLNSVEQVSDVMSLGMLRHHVFEALDNHSIYGDDLSIDVFNTLVQQLFDAGLMLTGTAEPFDVSSAHNFANLYSMPIRLGVHLHDVESAIEETLGEQDMYRRIMDRAKNAKRG